MSHILSIPRGGGGSAPINDPQPSDVGLLSWSFDPVGASATFTPTAGTLYVARQAARKGGTIASAAHSVQTAGSGATPLATCFVGCYDKLGVLRGKSIDETANFSSGGIRFTPIIAEAGQSLAIDPADDYCWLALLIGQQATTPVVLRSGAGIAGVANVGLNQNSNPPARSLQKAAVGVALPATIDLTTFAANNTLHFCGFL